MTEASLKRAKKIQETLDRLRAEKEFLKKVTEIEFLGKDYHWINLKQRTITYSKDNDISMVSAIVDVVTRRLNASIELWEYELEKI